jgi:tetratricopeptide (TPR) repeat protein
VDARELLDQGLVYERGGALDRALERYQAVLRGSADAALVARAWTRIAHARRTRCEWGEALHAADEAERAAAGAGLAAALGEALNARAAVLHARGELVEAARVYRRILDVTDDLRVCAMAHQNLGAIAAVQGDLGTAEACFAEASESFARAGDSGGEAYVRNSYAAIALDRRDFALAEERGRAAIHAALHVGDTDLLGIARSNHAEALIGLGRYAEAEDALTAALGHFQTTANSWARVHCLRKLGELHARRGQSGTGLRFFQHALALAERIGAQGEADELRERVRQLAEGGDAPGPAAAGDPPDAGDGATPPDRT